MLSTKDSTRVYNHMTSNDFGVLSTEDDFQLSYVLYNIAVFYMPLFIYILFIVDNHLHVLIDSCTITRVEGMLYVQNV